MSGEIPRVSGSSNAPVRGVKDEITVQDKETLAGVAKRVGIPVGDLIDANKGIDKKKLTAGQVIQYPKDMLVAPGEKTLEDVAKRLGMGLSDLEKANPNLKGKQLTEGQSIRYPKDFFDLKATGTPQRGVKSHPLVSSEGGPGTIKKGEGGAVYAPPKIKIGGREIGLPDVRLNDGMKPGVGGTSSVYDGDGAANVERRKQEQQNITNTRRKDERDPDYLDDATKKKLDEEKSGPGRRITDEQIQKGVGKKTDQPNIKQEAGEISEDFRKKKENLDQDLQRRLAKEAADFARRGGR
jgi:murein DD-endopeptidase MepM/ murein hydrolase activator NlpD